MTNKHQPEPSSINQPVHIRIIRHNEACQKLGVSSAKLFDMIAKGQFLKPFTLVPGGRAVGFLESDVDHWIVQRKATFEQEAS